MNTKRLTKLIEFMEKNDGRVHMRQWFSHKGENELDGAHDIHEPDDLKPAALLECGMAACALGWACMVPSLRRAGLSVARDFGGSSFYPTYQGSMGYAAAQEFFDLSTHQSRRLFGHGIRGVRTPKQWAKRARSLLREWQRP